jgi:hypothetical protein
MRTSTNSLHDLVRPVLLDLFCGVGGWSKAFMARGWTCVGVDIAALGYPGVFWQMDVAGLAPDLIDQFDGVTASPPCEEFARAWLPWLRGDHTPEKWAIDLLKWSVALCSDRQNRITECSAFAGKHVGGGQRFESYVLWGDVPLLMPRLPRGKAAKSGMRPELRAEIPPALANWIAECFTKNYRSNATAHAGAVATSMEPLVGPQKGSA